MVSKRAQIDNKAEFFGTESIWKILLKISPPVMLSQLVLSLYNIVDSLFVGQYSGHGLTALSVIYPLQLIITALAVGTGVGANTYMSRLYARGEIRNGGMYRLSRYVFGRRMVKGSSGARQYGRADDSATCGRGNQHTSRLDIHIRNGCIEAYGRARRGSGNDNGTIFIRNYRRREGRA